MDFKTKFAIWCMVTANCLILFASADCPFTTVAGTGCVHTLNCAGSGNELKIFEDCEVGDMLFTVSDLSLVKEDLDCPFLKLNPAEKSFYLNEKLDAEVLGDTSINCKLQSKVVTPTFVKAADVNEFSPQPIDGNRVTEVEFEEGQGIDELITKFSYEDQDFGENDTLNYAWISIEFEDTFDLSQVGNEFQLRTKQDLDYEQRSIYKLEFSIISVDERDDKLNTTHTVLLFVKDVGDTKPYWLITQPSATLPEGVAGREVYEVKAADRDFEINNPVKYSITDGNDEGFFEVDQELGKVKLAKDIDHEKDTIFFTLTIEAQEYIGVDKAPAPSNATTITNLNIEDVNDENPTFLSTTYEVDMVEVVDQGVSVDVDIYVCDADSLGDYNRYTVTSDKKGHLKITPDSPRGNSSIQLEALYRADTIFDYETHLDPIVITLTATEVLELSHESTATLTINLLDLNDNPPKFIQDDFEVNIPEDKGQGYSVAEVEATDDDRSAEFGTPSIRYSVNCTTILNVDSETGIVTLAKNGALNYETNKEVVCAVYADDDEASVGSNQAVASITIHVEDVNDEPPSITVTNGDILENSSEGTTIGVSIEANDEDTSASLSFEIDWSNSKAFKDGEPVSIDDIKDWFVVDVDGPTGRSVTGALKVGTVPPDREVADKVTLSVKVIDDKTATGVKEDTAELMLTILDENDSDPQFEGSYDALTVMENSLAATEFATIIVSDADENDQVTFAIDDTTYVDVQQDGTSFSAKLVVSGEVNIDREESSTITVIVTVTDGVGHSKSKTLVIAVDDENDNAPAFVDDIIFASFTQNDEIGKPLVTFKALDADLAEVLQYQGLNDFLWHGGGPVPPPDVPFRVTNDDIGNASLTLNFDPLGVNSGYCNFTVECLDKDNKHSALIEARVYAITADYQVNVYYNNPLTETQSKFIAIQSTFSDVYKYPCIIDSIAEGTDNTKSVAIMHFINEDKNEPVEAAEIIAKTNDGAVAQELVNRNNDIGLDLQNVGSTDVTDDGGNLDQVLLLQILVAVVGLVLLSLLLLMIIVYLMKTRSLERRLKVATATTFGSVASDLNRMGATGEIPGSNKFAGEGANPMYNLSDADLRNDDSSSIGSGDSVLVGVEDDPDFKGYIAGEGHSNPAFSRSIDEVVASFGGGGTTSNPLMDADLGGQDGDLSDALKNFDLFIRRDSDVSGVSGDSPGVDQNPNFTFGPN